MDVIEIGSAFVTIRPEVSGFEAELAAAVSGAETSVNVTADTEQAEGAIADVTGDDVEIGVDADTSAAVDAIDSVPDGEVEITANTEQAEASLDQVKEKVDETTDATGRLGEAAQGALGGMGGLGGAAGGAAGALDSTALAGGAAAAGLFSFSQAAIDAESAAQRFDLITGGMGDSIRTIDVGGLSGDIGELALKLGSSDEAMLNASASFVTFGQSTGASNNEIVAASNNINALALRAVALNPSLGDAGAVAERMTNALARGGRATTAFGIGLTSAEINARAMADTGKASATELTQFEKAAAGAAIATERLGDSMGSDFAAGATNARTEWNRMTESLGEAQETVGGQMLPAIENITQAIAELGDGMANMDPGSWLSGLWDIGPGLIANGFFDLRDSIMGTGESASAAGSLVGQLPPALMAASGATDTFSAAADDATDAVGRLDTRVQGYLDGVFRVPEAERALRDSFEALSSTLAQPSHTADDVAESLQGVVTQAAALGVATGDMTGAVDAAVFGLLGLQNQGILSADQVAAVKSQLESLPGNTESPVSTPGAVDAKNQARAVGDALLGIPPGAHPPVSVPGAVVARSQAQGVGDALLGIPPSRHPPVSTPGATTARSQVDTLTGALLGIPPSATSNVSAPGLSSSYGTARNYRSELDHLDGRQVTSYVNVVTSGSAKASARGGPLGAGELSLVGEEGPEFFVPNTGGYVIPAQRTAAMLGAALDKVNPGRANYDDMTRAGAALGRQPVATVAPMTVVHQTVMPNGDVLAESVFEVDRRQTIAMGYEQ